MNLWWNCPNCNKKVDFSKEMSSVFDDNGEADFSTKKGLAFHTIYCECDSHWVMSIGEYNKG